MAKLEQLATLVGGEIKGNSALNIERVAPIDIAQTGDITFIANPKYLPQLDKCKASAVIVGLGVEAPGRDLIICANPYLAFAKILTFLQPSKKTALGVMAGAIVADTAEVDATASLYPGCVVGDNATIGAGTTLYPGVVIYSGAKIGKDCLLHANSVVREGCCLEDRVILQPGAIIGSDGFGFAPDGASYYKIPQVGIVILEDDVEIGSNSCIDRAAMGVTKVGCGTKIDNLVQIAHNVEIGEDCILVSQSGIAGSSKVGNHCTFGGQAAVAGHLTIGDNVMIGGRGGATNNVESNQVLSGLPLMPHKQWLRATMSLPKLPEMRKEMKQLKKRLDELEAQLTEK